MCAKASRTGLKRWLIHLPVGAFQPVLYPDLVQGHPLLSKAGTSCVMERRVLSSLLFLICLCKHSLLILLSAALTQREPCSSSEPVGCWRRFASVQLATHPGNVPASHVPMRMSWKSQRVLLLGSHIYC